VLESLESEDQSFWKTTIGEMRITSPSTPLVTTWVFTVSDSVKNEAVAGETCSRTDLRIRRLFR